MGGPDEDALVRAVAAAPDDVTLRLVLADWLEDRGHPGGAYLRAEAALHAAGPGAADRRRELLGLVPGLPAAWRDRFEQPDVLLAPPAPFATGWYAANAAAPVPYRALANLSPEAADPLLPWLAADGWRTRVDQAVHEGEELRALAEVERRAAALGLTLPAGFTTFARDFPRRSVVAEPDHYFDFGLQDATVLDFPRVGDGYLVVFFGDMNYGNPYQLTWALYLVPGVDWHCVVAFELADDAFDPLPHGPDGVVYCAPSFQAFLRRWCLERRAGRAPGG